MPSLSCPYDPLYIPPNMDRRKEGLSIPRPAHLWGRKSGFHIISASSSLSSEGRHPKVTRWVKGLWTSGSASARGSGSDAEKMSMSMSDESSAGILSAGEQADEQTELPSGLKLALIVFALCMSILVMSLGIYHPLLLPIHYHPPFPFSFVLARPPSLPSSSAHPLTPPDNNVIATAIPTITSEFSSLPDMGWYGSAYLLTTASLQLPFGKLYTFLSIKRVFLVAIAIFELGSLVCGVARDSRTLILGRAIAGVGGAGIFTGAFTVLAYSVPLEKRPVYTGAISESSLTR